MAHKSLVPKQRALTETESQTSFDTWVEGMTFHISLSDKSSRFLSGGDLQTWTTAEDRGFTDDTGQEAGVTDETKMNRHTKKSLLNVILGSIAGYAPVISAKFIKHQSTSLESIWNRLRMYYGFRRTGSRILDLMEVKLENNESRESLWEKLYSFTEDQLLTPNGGISHNNVKQETTEEFTPTLLNLLVTVWLHTIHPSLPSLVKQRFSTQLRSCTVFTIREEISDAIPVILAELEEKECSVNRAGTSYRYSNSRNRNYTPRPPKPSCCLCKASGRAPSNHYLSTCQYLPPADKKFLTKAREITMFNEDESDNEEEEFEYDSKNRNISYIENDCSVMEDQSSPIKPGNVIRKVDVDASPVLAVSVNGITSHFTLDSGAEASVIEEAECARLGLNVKPTTHRATQGDGKTPLETVGEVHFTARRGHHELVFSGIVVKYADSPVLAGAAFHRINKLSIDYGRNHISLNSCCQIKYDPIKRHRKSTVRALKINKQTCILPGETVSFQLPDDLSTSESVAIEPRFTPSNTPEWIQCSISQPDADGSVAVCNTSTSPILLSKHTTPCQARPTTDLYKHLNPHHTPNTPHIVSPVAGKLTSQNLENHSSNITPNNLHTSNTVASPSHSTPPPTTSNSSLSQLKASVQNSATSYLPSTDNIPSLTKSQINLFKEIHKNHEPVFSPGIGKYNGYSGKFSHSINMNENVPPQRKGKIPDYSKGDKDTLQEKFDILLNEGVLSRAEDIDQPVEYVHPSFLVKKPSGGHRLVTSFGQMAEYTKPQPTTSTNIEHALHQIGQFEELIITDLKDSYYQIPLDPDSSKYVGVVTPYTGTFVYTRSVMGLPGSESALEELLSRIFGDLIKEGKMVKVADDLFLGSKNTESLAKIYDEVLSRLQQNGLKLSSSKTRICPESATILGWEWRKGSISPGQHRINALSACDPPNTVKALRSYLGCYKFLSRVVPCYAEVLQPLETACSNKESKEKVEWTEDLLASFNKSKEQLQKIKPIVLPKRDEQLHIVTDASSTGLGATLFVVRNSKLRLAGYFSAALRPNQSKLLPCELEALSISVSLKHFAYFIIQSTSKTRILTDSRPCVLSYKKLLRGQFSTSPKVTTFLSSASRYGVEIIHISGTSNIFSDFASRNPVECKNPQCSICEFINEECNSTVGEITVSDVLSGKAKLPFATKSAWLEIQNSCPDLAKVQRCLKNGSIIPKTKKNLTDVKRYLSCGVTSLDGQHKGLLVIKQSTPFLPTSNRIVVPRRIADGLLTAIHLNMNHPSLHQLKMLFSREFFCLDIDSKARQVTEQCYTCTALKKLPSTYHQQTTSIPEKNIGTKFAADIVNRYSQCILLLREDITSFTVGTIVQDEKATTLKDGLLLLTSRLRAQQGPFATIRVDPASSFRSLANNDALSKYNLKIQLGDEKNINKNPVAESAVQELHSELKKIQPAGGKITETTLSQALSNMNSLIRNKRYSSLEAWTKRNMKTGDEIPIVDEDLIQQKYNQRIKSHESSAKYKSRGKIACPHPQVDVGQLTFLYSDASKLKPREKYIVTKIEEKFVWIQKFTKNQLRSREYRVKKSDLLLIPKETSTNEFLPEPLEEDGYNERFNPHRTNPVESHEITSFSDTDSESEDEDNFYKGSILTHLLPNKPLRDNETSNEFPDIDLIDFDSDDPEEERGDSDILNEDSEEERGHSDNSNEATNSTSGHATNQNLNHSLKIDCSLNPTQGEETFEVHLSNTKKDNIVIHVQKNDSEIQPSQRLTRSQTAKLASNKNQQ